MKPNSLAEAEPRVSPGDSAKESTAPCPACGAGELMTFLDLGMMPTQIGIQWPTSSEARGCRRGRILLAGCDACGFVTNIGYSADKLDYAQAYDNDLSFSPVFQEFERDLVERLVRDHDLGGKRVLEIGCGHGKFLKRLCEAGGMRGVGFDPSHQPTSDSDGRVEFVADYYPDAKGPRDADLIVCRQVFEHVPDPLQFLLKLRRTFAESARSVLYFEVPSFDYVLDELAMWTLIYEHCSYFTRQSLSAVFANAGFEVLRAGDCFHGQFLGLEAVPSSRPAPAATQRRDQSAVAERIRSFTSRLEEKLAGWNQQMAQLAAEGKRVVVWGAGARAVCFFNLVEGADQVPFVVDVNPNKLGKYVPGTGQQIVGPTFLSAYQPDVVIIMNDIYRNEIRESVEALKLQVQFLSA